MFKLRNSGFFVFFALIFIFLGIIISSNFNLSFSSKEAYPEKSFIFKSEESPFVKVAEMVSPSVVNISAEKVLERRYHEYFPFDEFFRRFFGEKPPERVIPPEKYKSSSLGSGFIIKEDGHILTNNHVVAGADKIWVRLPDGSEYKAKLMGADKETDLAVLKIDPDKKLAVVTLGDSDSIKVGEWAIAIGNPFPQLGLDRTVTVGVISAVGRNLYLGEDITPYYQNYIQTDASINPGNSGGPLVNIRGEVIGINSAITNPTGMKFNIGIGFALPINLAKSVLPDLMAGRKVKRGYLGVYIGNVTFDLAEALDLGSTDGVIINQVQENTPAEKAGLKRGDVVIEFNGKKVKDVQQFMLMVAETPPENEVKLKVIRDGKKISLEAKLTNKADFIGEAEPEKEKETEKWIGLEVVTSTKKLAAQYKVKWVPGVLVISVEPGSPAEKKGIKPGDIIMEIDQREVKNLFDYEEVVLSLKDRKKAIPFLILRNGNTIFLAIKP